MSFLKIKDENGNFIPVKALNGKTPVKGVDYFNEADKQEIVNYVSENIEVSTDNLSTVPVEKGGTGATDADTARTKLGITPANIGAVSQEEFNALTIGGTNLLVGSNATVEKTSYLMGYYNLSANPPQAGETVTIRIWGTLGSDRTKFLLHNTSGGADASLGQTTDNGDGTHTLTVKWRIGSGGNTSLQVYQLPSSGTTASKITKIKLERGNKATDWSPVIEDITPASIGAQTALGFTPVQQGGGTNQGGNKIYLGWSNENKLSVQVDSTNLGNLITDSSVYGVILPVPKGGTGAKTAPAARTNLDVFSKAESKALYAANILDNSDFTNFVNQRGNGSTSGSWAHCIDRWIVTTKGAHPVWHDSDHLAVYDGDQVTQPIEPNKIKIGKTYTIACKIRNGVICANSGTVNSNDEFSVQYSGNGAGMQLYSTGNGNWYFKILGQTTNNFLYLDWVALYEGAYTAETLPAYKPKGYAHELMECQRYYLRLATEAKPVGFGYTGDGSTSSSKVIVVIPIPIRMRANPSLAGSTGFSVSVNGSVLSTTSTTFHSMDNNSVLFLCQGPFPPRVPVGVSTQGALALNAEM